jgi:thymidylate kinase
MKRIIVEGPDGSGKTTLIRALTNRFPQLEPLPGFKKQTQEKFYDNWVFQQLLYDPSPRVPIHDRFYYSELVYGMVLRGHIEVLPGNQRRIEQVLREHCFLVYCNVPQDVLIRAASGSPQMDGVLQDLDVLREQYEQLMLNEYHHYGPSRFQQYDYTNPGTEEGLMTKLGDYLE